MIPTQLDGLDQTVDGVMEIFYFIFGGNSVVSSMLQPYDEL